MTARKTLSHFAPGRGYTQQDWDEVSDSPEWTEEDFKNARPFAEVFPDLAESIRRGRGPQKAPTKKLVSLRISPDVLEKFKAGGARLAVANRRGPARGRGTVRRATVPAA